MIDKFEDNIKTGYHLVDFYASWCGPCKIQSSIIDSLDEDIDVIKIDCDSNDKLVLKYRIMSIPTLLLFKDGKMIKEMVGLVSKEDLESIIKENR